MIRLSGKNLLLLYSLLRKNFGFQNWWPAETNDEMVIGAILTQNTSWKNVEKAIEKLKEEKMLNLNAIARSSAGEIAKAIRSSGFYRQKASRLKAFAEHIVNGYGSIESFFKKSKDPRKELLSIKGIGKETADSMLLYAGNMPFFIIDAYTKRVMERVFSVKEKDYDKLQEVMHRLLPKDIALYQDYHAQIVELAKRYCKKRPLCEACPLNKVCSFAKAKAQ